MVRHTIFTPTYNRAKTLPRLYESIKAQTFKEFCWLIIDDGSKDETFDLVRKWKDENIVNIKYVFKENGGKHSAMKLAFEIIETKYVTTMDSDDVFTPYAMEWFDNEWKCIEQSKREKEFALVRLFCQNLDGTLPGFGSFSLHESVPFIDGTWQDLVLIKGCFKELCGSLNVRKFKECVNFNDYLWHNEEIKYIGEALFWAAIGRRYKTRLLNKIGCIYYLDGEGSLLREKKNEKHYINDMVNHLYFLNENIQFFFWNPVFFIKFIIKYIIAKFIVKEPFYVHFSKLKHLSLKILYILLFIPSFLLYNKMKYFDKKFYLG